MFHRAIRHRSSPRARFYPQRRRKHWSTNSWRTQSNSLVAKTKWPRGSTKSTNSLQPCTSTNFDHPYRPKHKEITWKTQLNFSNKRRGQKRSQAFNSILVSNSSIVDEPQPPIDSSTAEYLRHPRVITSITDILPMSIIPIERAFTHRTTTNNMHCDDQSLYSPLHSYHNAFDESPFDEMIHRKRSIRAWSRIDSLVVGGHNDDLFYSENDLRNCRSRIIRINIEWILLSTIVSIYSIVNYFHVKDVFIVSLNRNQTLNSTSSTVQSSSKEFIFLEVEVISDRFDHSNNQHHDSSSSQFTCFDQTLSMLTWSFTFRFTRSSLFNTFFSSLFSSIYIRHSRLYCWCSWSSL